MMFVNNLPMMIFIKHQVANCRRKRSIPDPQVEPHTIHGGERAFLYQVSHWCYMQSIICKQSKVDNVSYIISMFPVCGGLPVHLWHGRQGLPPESHLRDARVPSPWLRPRWRTPRSLPHVSHRVKQKCLLWFYSSTPTATSSWKTIENVSPRPSRSSYQKKMSEYIGAELAGRKEGDCFKFERDCSRFDSKLFCKVPPTTICLSSDRSSSWTSIQGRHRW